MTEGIDEAPLTVAPQTLPSVVLLSPPGVSTAERWLAAARTNAAQDLVSRLPQAGFSPVLAVAETNADRDALAACGAEILEGIPKPFHFGRVLKWIAERKGLRSLAYFGAASAPLADEADLDAWRQQYEGLPDGGALVNNVHSSDWALVRDARLLAAAAESLENDNALGWVLRETLGVKVAEPPATAAARADLDTPGDLAMIHRHPGVGPALRQNLASLPVALRQRAEGLRELLGTPASSLALVGRVSAEVWLEVVRRTRIWVRVYAEERGMRASGRQARGEVRSLVGDLVDDLGPERFLSRLGSLVGGAVWDTRVWMAQKGRWPSVSDRMACDLGWADQIEDTRLRDFALAVAASGLPVLTGGHGVVAGSLLAMLESLPASP